LQRDGQAKPWVQPVVVLWGDFAQRSIHSQGVSWVRGKELAAVLADRRTTLSPARVGEIVDALETSFVMRDANA
jgi:hypothetical protein